MVFRVIAGVVLVAGLGFIGWTVLGSDAADETATAATGSEDGSADEMDISEAEGAAEEAEETAAEPENFGPRKDLVDLDGWLNTDIASLDELDGQVVMVEMWTFGCFNCKNRIPHTQELYAEFGNDGFEIVGVHAPEFSYEAEVPAIEEAIDRLGVTWPVALDTEKKNFRAWQDGGRRFWPRTLVIVQNGDVRFDHIGEGAYDELEDTVRYLLEHPPEPKA